MFIFTENEQESIRFFILYFSHHYSSDSIYQRISNNKLTQGDLIALDSKVRTMLQIFQREDRLTDVQQLEFMLNMARNASVVLNALARYRVDEYKADKLNENRKKRSEGNG